MIWRICLLEKKYILIIITFFLLVFLVLASEVLLPFLVGVILAYILNPVVVKLNKFGIYHSISVLLVLLISLFLFFGSFIFLIPIFLDQLDIVIKKMPVVLDKINMHLSDYNNSFKIIDKETYTNYFANFIESKSGQILSYLLNFLTLSLNKTFAILNFIGLILITPIVTFYILYDWDEIVKKIKSKIFLFLNKGHEKKITNINNLLSSFFRGQLIVNFILAIFYSVSLYSIGVEGAISIGFLIGVLSFIPYFGFIVGLLISLSFAIIQFASLNYLIVIILIFIFGQLLESYYLSPKFVSRNIGLHPLFSMFVIIASGAAFGFIGVLLAIPLSAILLNLVFDEKK